MEETRELAEAEDRRAEPEGDTEPEGERLDTKGIQARVQQGRKHIDWFPVPEWDRDLVPLRPLTDAESNEVETITMRGQIIRRQGQVKDGEKLTDAQAEAVEVELDMEKMMAASHEADRVAVAHALADGKLWTPKDVGRFEPPGVVKTIAARVYEISAGTKKDREAVETFRDESGGTEDRPVAPDGGAAGQDPS